MALTPTVHQRSLTPFMQLLTKPLGRGALEAPLELGFEPQDGLGVQLGDARLGYAEHLADLAQRELVVVVEGDHGLLAVGEPADRAGKRLAYLGARHLGRRVVRVRVL